MPRDKSGAESAAGAGLVSVSTTGVPDGVLVLVKDEMRFVRLQKNIGVGAKLLEQNAPRRCTRLMVTLTYRDGGDWCSDHMSTYVRHVREWLARKGHKLAYVWVAETQERGAIHYHVIFWMPKGITMPKADKRGWWPHGMSKTEVARKPVGYLISYAKKLASKDGLPKGARIYGVGGLARPGRCVRRWINWPSFIQARASVADSYGRQAGGGWVNRVTGEWWPSEYGLCLSTRRQTVIKRLHDHGRPVANVAGPFNWLHQRGGVDAAFH